MNYEIIEDDGLWLNGLHYPYGSAIVMSTRAAKYFLLNDQIRVVSDDNTPLPPLPSGSGIGSGVGGGLFAQIAYAPVIPFKALTRMPKQTVSGALTFTPSTVGAAAGATCYLTLIADGVHTPDFSAFTEWGGSAGYENTAGILNICQFFYDGETYYVCITQPIGQGSTGGTVTPPPVVTPPATQLFLRLTQTFGLTEATDGSGYSYTPTGTNDYGSGFGLSTKSIPAGADGYVGQTLVTPVIGGPIVGLTTASTAATFDSMLLDYGIYVYGDVGSTYKAIRAGAGNQPVDAQIAVGANDLMRVRRSGTTVVAEVSKDNGSTWIKIKTWASASSAAMRGYFQSGVPAGVIKIPFGSTNMA